MAFDAAGNLYVTNFTGQTVTKLATTGALVGLFGSGYNADPESIVFDAAGNAYVGQADGTHQVLKFNSAGTLVATFSVVTENRGSDWIDLAPDGCTLFYTSEGAHIKRFDVCKNTQPPDFNTTPLPPEAFALRLLPGGGLLVANTSVVARLDASGNQVQTYALAREGCLFALALDPDGTSFWVSDECSADVFKIDIETGTQLLNFNTGTGSHSVFGLAVFPRLPTATDTTTLTSFPNPSVFGQAVTFTATVSVPSGVGTPTGSVQLFDGNTSLAQKSLSEGRATFSISELTAGTHSITAVYSGDANFTGSTSAVLMQTVKQADTTTAVGSSANPSVFGQSVTFTATVSAVAPGAGMPSGTVTFSDGKATLGTVALNISGQATFTPSTPLTVATHSITAAYGGDTNFNGSATPTALAQVVNKASTTTAVLPSANPANLGQLVTFTATVSAVAPGLGMPTGTVTLMDGAGTLGTGTLTSGQATFSTSALALGFHSISANYGGDSNFEATNGMTSTAIALPETIQSAPTVTGTVTVPSPLALNCTLQLVKITGTNFLPGFSVQFNGSGITPAPGTTEWIDSANVRVKVNVTTADPLMQTVTVTNLDGGTATGVSVMVGATTCPAGGGLAGGTTTTTITPPPTITSITGSPSSSPLSSGLRGQPATIAGAGFAAAKTSDVIVTFAGPASTRVTATVSSRPSPTDASLTLTVPITAVDGPVRVARAADLLLSDGFTFTINNPTLSAVIPETPAFRPSSGSNVVTLDVAGAKLVSGATITTSASTGITIGSYSYPTSGVCALPSCFKATITITSSAALGSRDVTVTNPDGGTSTRLAAFAVTSPALFVLTARNASGADITPSYLPTIESVTVTLGANGKCTAKTVSPTAVIIRADFTGTTPPSGATFTLDTAVTSANTGTATNEDCPLGMANDFSFNSNFTANNTAPASSVSHPTSTSWQTTLYAYDFGGKTRVIVTGTDGSTGSLTLPLDTDGDNLPDFFETNGVVPNVDASGNSVLNPLNAIPGGNDKTAADGLINYAKYRGVYQKAQQTSSTTLVFNKVDHIRLGVGMRHLFARFRGFANDPLILAGAGRCGISFDAFGNIAFGTADAGTNFCPTSDVSGAFVSAGVQVHDVTASFSASSNPPQSFPQTFLPVNSLDPARTTPLLDVATVIYSANDCNAGESPCNHTSKLPDARQWQFPTLGQSTYGTPTTYGLARVFKTPVDGYFRDRPYVADTVNVGTTLPSCGNVLGSGTTPCYVTQDGTTTRMLAAVTLVGDNGGSSGSTAQDNGIVNVGEVTAGGLLVGDRFDVLGSFTNQLSAMDATNDGCVELPFITDPRGVALCTNPAENTPGSKATKNAATDTRPIFPQANKQQVVRSLSNHELAHAVGVNTHTTDATDLMYQYSVNWVRDGHFSSTAAGLLQIHNGGVQ